MTNVTNKEVLLLAGPCHGELLIVPLVARTVAVPVIDQQGLGHFVYYIMGNIAL